MDGLVGQLKSFIKLKLELKYSIWCKVLFRSQNLLCDPRLIHCWGQHILGSLSKQIKGVRALKDEGAAFMSSPRLRLIRLDWRSG